MGLSRDYEKGKKGTMGDLIDRQVVIDAMAELQGRASTKAEFKGISKAWKRIKKLPSAQPQKMRGKWTYGEDEYGIDGYHCDKCGFFVP